MPDITEYYLESNEAIHKWFYHVYTLNGLMRMLVFYMKISQMQIMPRRFNGFVYFPE